MCLDCGETAFAELVGLARGESSGDVDEFLGFQIEHGSSLRFSQKQPVWRLRSVISARETEEAGSQVLGYPGPDGRTLPWTSQMT